jgi:tetratricopeptide (TPR) repeat protein
MASGRGRVLLAEVEALEKKRPFFGKRQHQEQTADKMVQCANAFRAERDFARSGDLYMRAARLYQELGDAPASAKAATDAAHMNAKDPDRGAETVAALNFAIDLFKAKEKRVEAADLLAELARVLAEGARLDEAVAALQQASDLYKEANAHSKAATVLESVADLLAERGEGVGAARFYREVAQMRLANQLTQTSSGAVFFKAAILQLQANDVVGAKGDIQAYLQANPTFRNNQLCKFLELIIAKIEEHDAAGFDAAVDEFKRYNSVQKWLAERLAEIRAFADEGDQGLL